MFVLILTLLSCQKQKSATPTDSLQALQKAVQASPSYNNYISLGLELANRKIYEEAMKAYEQAKTINPNAPVAWNNICALLNEQGRFADAIPNCEKALALEPKFELAANNLKYAQSQLPQHRAHLMAQKDQLLSKSNATAEELINLGLSLYRSSEFQAAADVWSRVGKSDKLYALSRNNVATAYIMLRKFQQAERALKEALDREPSNTLFLNNKKWLEESRK